MKKINFSTDVLPHALAVVVFLIVTVMFFRPVFLENKVLDQGDITQFLWSSRELREFRATTGEEGLWNDTMFSGMPAYMINLDWSDGPVVAAKKIMSLFLPHPVCNIFLAFVCYYIMLLAFRVRPYLAITGAIAFGLSSFFIVGLSAGHNARIGAMAFMPLVIAGIHLAFTNRKLLGFAVTALGMALHLRENHLQMTYYLAIIVGIYGIVEFISAIIENRLPGFAKNVGILAAAVTLAIGTFFGQLWAASEIVKYSHRGKTELTVTSPNADAAGTGLPKSTVFEFSNGILEPMTLMIPNFYGGSSSERLGYEEGTKTNGALVNSGDNQLANQLAQYSSAYWGPQRLAAPYYAGAIIVFLFVLGITMAEKKYMWWLVAIFIISIMLSWGSSFASFNYFLFNYLPGYSKFRSVTFSLIIAFMALPLLGCLGVEKFLSSDVTKETKRNLLIAFGVTAGICLVLFIFPKILDFKKPVEDQFPAWFLNALKADRKQLLRSDAIRSFGFIAVIFVLLFFNVPKRVSTVGFLALMAFLVTIDLSIVDSRYFSSETNYITKHQAQNFTPSAADARVMQDKSYYRVLNLTGGFYEAATSNFHNSLGGYSGVRLKRYQELYDSVISRETDKLFADANSGPLDMSKYGALKMLNTKYLIYGDQAAQLLMNSAANGNAWFPNEIKTVNSPNEELQQVAEVDTRNVAVVDQSKMKLVESKVNTDSAAVITFIEKKPYWQKYESQSSSGGLGVFSEIHYPKGWHATIDGQEVPIYRVDYVLRALEIPAGKHTIEFTFEPKPYVIGNKITMSASVLLLIVVVGALFLELREKKN